MINIIAAIAKNGTIGNKGKIPWYLPDDLQRFKKLTLGNVVIMGRRTYESIDPPLRNRTVIVITSQKDYPVVNGFSHHSLEKMIERFSSDEVFIAGGEEIYKQSLKFAQRMFVTAVHRDFVGDTYFPLDIIEDNWDLLSSTDIEEYEGLRYNYVILDKKNT